TDLLSRTGTAAGAGLPLRKVPLAALTTALSLARPFLFEGLPRPRDVLTGVGWHGVGVAARLFWHHNRALVVVGEVHAVALGGAEAAPTRHGLSLLPAKGPGPRWPPQIVSRPASCGGSRTGHRC